MKVLTIDNKKTLLKLQKRLRGGDMGSRKAEATVQRILREIQKRGDRALIKYTEQFDGHRPTLSQLRVLPRQTKQAYSRVSRSDVKHLRRAADRIRKFHERQKTATWKMQTAGVTLGQMVRPLQTIGMYVPGGKASYPSSVLMNAIPARVAGVRRIIMCSPTPKGEINPYLVVAADIAGVDEIYTVGGAQAVGAMAFGTGTIPNVDKIVGPGNIYVALAKKQVSGIVGIDMLAGPSEIVVIADDSAHPEFIAADLLSQAEHDERAMSILITTSNKLIKVVKERMGEQLTKLKRKHIIKASLNRFGMILKVRDLKNAMDVANVIAPEHLELAIEHPYRYLPAVQHAGAVFLGHYTTESLGDYVAGPNHVLPTGGTARFSSPLSVDDFIKKTNLISFTKRGLLQVRDTVVRMAMMEGLQAHARAVEVRVS